MKCEGKRGVEGGGLLIHGVQSSNDSRGSILRSVQSALIVAIVNNFVQLLTENQSTLLKEDNGIT